jgi:excisionase family DNA binding protein
MVRETYKVLEEMPLMLDCTSLSKALNISKTYAYYLMHRDDFPSIKLGRRHLINKESLLNWLRTKEASH